MGRYSVNCFQKITARKVLHRSDPISVPFGEAVAADYSASSRKVSERRESVGATAPRAGVAASIKLLLRDTCDCFENIRPVADSGAPELGDVNSCTATRGAAVRMIIRHCLTDDAVCLPRVGRIDTIHLYRLLFSACIAGHGDRNTTGKD